MLRKRIKTALILAPIFVALIIFLPDNLFSFLVLILAAISFWEFFQLAQKSGTISKNASLIGIISGVFFCYCLLFDVISLVDLLPSMFIILFIIFLFFKEMPSNVFLMLSVTFFGVIYIGLLAPYLAHLRNQENGVRFFFMLIIMVWLSDTGGYFVGKAYGKHKLYHKISPGKTVEGAAAQILASIIGALVSKLIIFQDISLLNYIIMAIFVGTFGILGDLCESLIKRNFNAKDSGTIIPGHGGILDRFDAFLFSAPFLYYYLKIIGY